LSTLTTDRKIWDHSLSILPTGDNERLRSWVEESAPSAGGDYVQSIAGTRIQGPEAFQRVQGASGRKERAEGCRVILEGFGCAAGQDTRGTIRDLLNNLYA
jgi:hypothetical protein